MKMPKVNTLHRFNSLICTTVLVIITSFFAVYSTHAQENPHDMSTMGRDLFIENRCVRCHTIGRGRFVGPDLGHVGDRYTREELVRWITNPQEVYQATGKMPVNEGYPPMPPMEIHPMAASAIADYLLTVEIKPDTVKGGTIAGKVINKTSDAAVQDVNITLTSFMGDKETGKTDVVTGPDGVFDFKELPWDRSYMVTLSFDGADYSTDKMVFYPGEDTKTLELPVYDPTTSPEDISVTESHMIVQAADGGISVADLSMFDNKGSRMYVGSVDAGDGKKETLKFSLPNEASNVNFIHGLDPAGVVRTSGGFSDTASVLPGSKRVVFAYSLPEGSGDRVIEKTIEYPTGSFLLLVSESSGAVNVEGLTGGDTVPIENERFYRWVGTDLKPGHRIIINITVPFDSSVYVKWGAIGVVLLLIAAGIIYSSLRGKGGRRGESGKTVTREALMDRRSSLIKEIAAMDDSYEAGRMDEAEYKKSRESKKEELVEITRRLRF